MSRTAHERAHYTSAICAAVELLALSGAPADALLVEWLMGMGTLCPVGALPPTAPHDPRWPRRSSC